MSAQNELMKVHYETALGVVDLDFPSVKNYLVRGQADKITDQEVVLFMKMCQAQKLNPFVQGEAYLIKFGNDPAQMVVGKDAYTRRAEENPLYLGYKSGIVVLRGNDVIQKEGTCLYPGEELLGGWCRVNRLREATSEKEEVFKEVSLEEYNKGQANWKTKPCTMIEKVAVSQALRAAFPKEYEGLYVAEEVSPNGCIDADFRVGGDGEAVDMTLISKEQRTALFNLVYSHMGKEQGNGVVSAVLEEFGLESTKDMPVSTYEKVLDRLMEILQGLGQSNEGEDAPPEQADPGEG